MVQKQPSQETPRARGRPRAYDPGEALRRIRDVFWIKGYAATSLDDLAEAAGMNRPSLYAAFGDKEAMYLAALKMQGASLVNAIGQALALDLKISPWLDVFFERCIDTYMQGAQGPRGCFLVGTALTESLMREDVGAAIRDIFGRCDGLIEKRFEMAKKAGELPPKADPAALAMAVSAAMRDLAMHARAGEPRENLMRRAALTKKLTGLA